jgi:hypothetical protein
VGIRGASGRAGGGRVLQSSAAGMGSGSGSFGARSGAVAIWLGAGVRSARGWRAGGDAGCCPASGSFGSRGMEVSRAGGDAARCRGSGSFGSSSCLCPRMHLLRRARLRLDIRPARLRAVPAARLGAGMADRDRVRRGANTGHGEVPRLGMKTDSWVCLRGRHPTQGRRKRKSNRF